MMSLAWHVIALIGINFLICAVTVSALSGINRRSTTQPHGMAGSSLGRGLIAELELHTLKMRLHAGLINNSGGGDLALRVPGGLVRYLSGRVVQHPDQEVRGASPSSLLPSCG